MKLYYAYKNWTTRAYSAHDVMVHLHGCAHCPFDYEGRRRGPEPSGANDQWHRLGDPKLRRNDVEPFGAVLADAHHLPRNRTDSGCSRVRIPEQSDHRIRSKVISHSGGK